MSYVEKYKPSINELTWVMVVGTVLLLLLAYGVMKYVDDPIRKWLSR
jgi:peptidoglycan/LPS O-acetylase OafA/YrhL